MRGISPIVATVLLIAIVIAIGALLYMGVSQMVESTSGQQGQIYSVVMDAFVESVPRGAYGVYFHYYVPVSTGMNWIDAFYYCRNRGMFLAAPKSVDQLNKLKEILRSRGWTTAWVGIYQQPGAPEPDKGWFYVTGGEMGVIGEGFWASGQPSGDVNENVGAIVLDGLHDHNAALLFPFICEKIRIGFTVTNVSSEGILRLNNISVQVYDALRDELLAARKGDFAYWFAVDVGGNVIGGINLPFLRCDRWEVPPNVSATCSLWGVPLKEVPYESARIKICLVGEGINVCDTVKI